MGKLELELEVKSSADKFWGGIKESSTLYPKIFPEIKSIETIQGDGHSVGSVRLLKYAEGTPNVTFSKEKIDAFDDAKKSMTFSVIDGELVHVYKNFNANLQVVPKGDGSLVKWSVEYEKVSSEVPEPNYIKDYAAKTLTDLDAYLSRRHREYNQTIICMVLLFSNRLEVVFQ